MLCLILSLQQGTCLSELVIPSRTSGSACDLVPLTHLVCTQSGRIGDFRLALRCTEEQFLAVKVKLNWMPCNRSGFGNR